MGRLIRLAADHPWVVLSWLAVCSILAASQLGHLRVSISAESMLKKDTLAWDYYLSTEEAFGTEDLAIVVLHDPDVFNTAKLRQIRSALHELAALPAVVATTSLFNAKNLKNVDDTIHLKPFLDTLPMTPAEAAAVREDAIANPLVLGNLISVDGRTLAINLHLKRDPRDTAFDRGITAAIEQRIAPLREHIAEVYQVGAAATSADLTARIHKDQQVLLPLSVAVLLLTLLLSLRRANAVVMPLATAGISVVWTLGFMGWIGIPLNMMTSIVPALVIIIGSTEDIHLLAEYAAGVQDGLDRTAAIERMADHMGVAVLLTFITTYLGFLSITLNDIQLLSQFGLVASTGLLFNFIVTVLLVPVMLRWFGHRRPAVDRQGIAHAWMRRSAVAAVRAILRHRPAVLGTAVVLVFLALLAATLLRINNNMLDYLDPTSALRGNIERVHHELSGVHTFSVVIDSGIENTFQQVKYLKEVKKIQAFIDGMGSFDRSFSFVDFVALVHRVMDDPKDTRLRLPETDDIVREYLTLVRQDDVATFVSANYDRTRILVRHDIGSSHRFNRAIKQLRKFINANIDPALRVEITGKSVLSNEAVEAMARGQLQSLLLVGCVIVGLVSVLFVSLRAGFIALAPNLFPVVILFAVMGVADIPLNAGTSMVAAIALGICVDDTMHLMARFHGELKRHQGRSAALLTTVGAEAVPIVSTSFALAAGFAVFAISSFQPVVSFGLLSAMVILVALLATFTLTPVLLGSGELLSVWDLLSYQVQKEAINRSPLFQGMYIWQVKKILLASEIRHFRCNEVIIREGEIGTEMFVVLKGGVEVRKRRDDGSVQRFRVLQPGDLCGEVGPLSGGLRTADVIALDDTDLLVLSWERIDRLTRRYPILAFRLFRNLTGIIGARLRQTTEYQVDAQPSHDPSMNGSTEEPLGQRERPP